MTSAICSRLSWLEQFALYERAIFFFKNYLGLKFTFFYKDKRELISLFKRATIVNNKRTNHSCHSLQKERKREERKSKSLFLRVDIEEKTRSSRPAFPLFMPKTRERIALHRSSRSL